MMGKAGSLQEQLCSTQEGNNDESSVGANLAGVSYFLETHLVFPAGS